MKTAALLNCRNDGYKEDERFITCINSMLETFDEVWYCDWNSPSDKGSLLWKLQDYIPRTGKIRHFIIDEASSKILTSNDPKIVLGKDLFEFFTKFDNQLMLIE